MTVAAELSRLVGAAENGGGIGVAAGSAVQAGRTPPFGDPVHGGHAAQGGQVVRRPFGSLSTPVTHRAPDDLAPTGTFGR